MSTTKKSKLEHGRILHMIALSSIRPHPKNEELYGPIDPRDPDVRVLAKDIEANGLLEPLVLTNDYFLLSGHRRHTACKLAGLDEVPCEIQDVDSNDPSLLEWLARYNRQRVKTADMVLREEVILSDPKEAHRILTEHRRMRATIDWTEPIELRPKKKRAKISAAKQPFLAAISRVINDYRKFWPLTDRQIHYVLVELKEPPLTHASKPNSIYVNDKESYRKLVDLLTRGRLTGEIPWRTIHDPTRPVVAWNMPKSIGPFIREEIDGFLKGYYRDLMQSQPNHVEIIGEKNTIQGVIKPVAEEYTIPYTIGRGYSSLHPRYLIAQRFKMSGKEWLILLVLSDFDPEGEDIAESFCRSMRDDFGIKNIKPIKVALTYDQVQDMELPSDQLGKKKKPKAQKRSSRLPRFVSRYGSDVFELEAIRPQEMQKILRDAINQVIDVSAFNAEIDREANDAAYLDGVRNLAKKNLGNIDELRVD